MVTQGIYVAGFVTHRLQSFGTSMSAIGKLMHLATHGTYVAQPACGVAKGLLSPGRVKSLPGGHLL